MLGFAGAGCDALAGGAVVFGDGFTGDGEDELVGGGGGLVGFGGGERAGGGPGGLGEG